MPSIRLPSNLLSLIFLELKTYTNGDIFLYARTVLKEWFSKTLST
jgi:hypothetical protein